MIIVFFILFTKLIILWNCILYKTHVHCKDYVVAYIINPFLFCNRHLAKRKILLWNDSSEQFSKPPKLTLIYRACHLLAVLSLLILNLIYNRPSRFLLNTPHRLLISFPVTLPRNIKYMPYRCYHYTVSLSWNGGMTHLFCTFVYYAGI